MYQNDCAYLKKADATKLSVFEIQRIDKIYQYGKEIDEAYKQNLYQEVIRIATEWIKIDNRESFAYNYRGYANIKLQNYQSALEDFTKAISYNPFHAYAFNNRGYCKIKLGKVQEAYMDLYTSMNSDDTNSYVWLNFAIYYMEISEIEKSLLHIEQALLLDPNTENINEYAALIYEKAGNQEKAQEYQKKQ
jgi:tetratricopeptide (TPR) repeat protein